MFFSDGTLCFRQKGRRPVLSKSDFDLLLRVTRRVLHLSSICAVSPLKGESKWAVSMNILEAFTSLWSLFILKSAGMLVGGRTADRTGYELGHGFCNLYRFARDERKAFLYEIVCYLAECEQSAPHEILR